MRTIWNLPLLAVMLLAAAKLPAQDASQPADGAQSPAGDGQESDFPFPARPLGAFQPTDIGLQGGPNGPMPPEVLSPDPQATSAGAGEQSLLSDEPGSVAPAQFQSPVKPKAAAEPKTTVVPPASAPAFQPAAPAASAEPPEPQSLAQSLYQQAITAPPAGALTGEPMTLHAALVRRSDPTRYAEFAKTYWDLSRSLASYYESVQGVSELARLPPSRLALEQALLQAARASAEAELQQLRVRAISAQLELTEQFSALPQSAPLPADLPLVSAYKSKFEAVFAGRSPPRGARRLHQSFEPRLSLIEARAAEVAAVENAFAALAESYAAGQTALDNVLRQHLRLQAARHNFLHSVYEYNASIADYAYLAAGPNRSPETIAAMLVERKKPTANEAVAPANFAAPTR